MRTRLVFWGSGASGVGAHAVDRKSTFFGVFKIKARPLDSASFWRPDVQLTRNQRFLLKKHKKQAPASRRSGPSWRDWTTVVGGCWLPCCVARQLVLWAGPLQFVLVWALSSEPAD